MTIALRYAARSDVGLLREGNEDSAYASGRLLAVADGMGGHAHGEVASSVAIAAMASLEETAGDDLLDSIETAVHDANRRLHEMVGRDPTLKGMGTTLTAMLWNGTQVALVHVGDSRAYLLRRGELYQITHDHTLVQQLVDDGRITPEEAATHPQRSILLKALDGSDEVRPDLALREAQVGDRYLLCSDGLSGVVNAETLHATLTNVDDPDEAVRQLIDLANRGGGPDNITCVIADVLELADGVQVPTEPAVVGAAGMSNRPQSTVQNDPAGQANAVTAPHPVLAEEEYDTAPAMEIRRRRRLWPLLVTALIVLLGAGGYLFYNETQQRFFIGADGDQVVVFRGVHTQLGPFTLYSLEKGSGRNLNELSEVQKASVEDGIPVDSVAAGLEKINALTFTPPPAEPPSTPTPSASQTPQKSGR